MRIAIIGSRKAPAHIVSLIMAHLPRHASEIVSGGASGVDTAAAEVAHRLSIPLRIFAPDYKAYGKAAGGGGAAERRPPHPERVGG